LLLLFVVVVLSLLTGRYLDICAKMSGVVSNHNKSTYVSSVSLISGNAAVAIDQFIQYLNDSKAAANSNNKAPTSKEMFMLKGNFAFPASAKDEDDFGAQLVPITVILTTHGYYEFERTEKQSKTISEMISKSKPLTDIHSITRDDHNPFIFYMNFFSGDAFSFFRRSTGKFNLKSRKFICSSVLQAQEWITIFSRLVRARWQEAFESQIIPSPEVYQRHFFFMHNQKQRLVVLSNIWMYNVEVTVKPLVLKEVKWCVPIHCLQEVQIGNDDQSVTTILSLQKLDASKRFFDAAHPQKDFSSAKKVTHEWNCRDKFERLSFIEKLHQVYFQTTKDGNRALHVV
jgi:hypothetical protein